MVLLVIRAKHRPDTSDKQNILTMLEAINSFERKHLGCVLTHCDLDTTMTMDKARGFLDKLFSFTKGKCDAPDDKNIYLFKGPQT